MKKVLHVNDVAGVASTLVGCLNSINTEAALYQPFVRTNLYNDSSFKLGRKLDRYIVHIARLRDIFTVRSLFVSGHYEILHIHYGYFGIVGYCGFLPYYLHCHGEDILGDLENPIKGWLTRISLNKAVKVFFSTPNMRRPLSNVRPDAIFIPNPAPPLPARLVHDSLQRHQNLGETVKILSVSKLDKRKGVPRIVETLKTLRDRCAPCEISAMGFGNCDPQVYQRAIEQLRGMNVRLLGPMKRTEFLELISNHDMILGQLSPEGAIGMTELEALALGKLVIADFRFPECYAEAVPIFAPEDEQCWAALARYRMSLEFRVNHFRKAIEWVHKYHNVGRIVQMLNDQYA